MPEESKPSEASQPGGEPAGSAAEQTKAMHPAVQFLGNRDEVLREVGINGGQFSGLVAATLNIVQPSELADTEQRRRRQAELAEHLRKNFTDEQRRRLFAICNPEIASPALVNLWQRVHDSDDEAVIPPELLPLPQPDSAAENAAPSFRQQAERQRTVYLDSLLARVDEMNIPESTQDQFGGYDALRELRLLLPGWNWTYIHEDNTCRPVTDGEPATDDEEMPVHLQQPIFVFDRPDVQASLTHDPNAAISARGRVTVALTHSQLCHPWPAVTLAVFGTKAWDAISDINVYHRIQGADSEAANSAYEQTSAKAYEAAVHLLSHASNGALDDVLSNLISQSIHLSDLLQSDLPQLVGIVRQQCEPTTGSPPPTTIAGAEMRLTCYITAALLRYYQQAEGQPEARDVLHAEIGPGKDSTRQAAVLWMQQLQQEATGGGPPAGTPPPPAGGAEVEGQSEYLSAEETHRRWTEGARRVFAEARPGENASIDAARALSDEMSWMQIGSDGAVRPIFEQTLGRISFAVISPQHSLMNTQRDTCAYDTSTGNSLLTIKPHRITSDYAGFEYLRSAVHGIELLGNKEGIMEVVQRIGQGSASLADIQIYKQFEYNGFAAAHNAANYRNGSVYAIQTNIALQDIARDVGSSLMRDHILHLISDQTNRFIALANSMASSIASEPPESVAEAYIRLRLCAISIALTHTGMTTQTAEDYINDVAVFRTNDADRRLRHAAELWMQQLQQAPGTTSTPDQPSEPPPPPPSPWELRISLSETPDENAEVQRRAIESLTVARKAERVSQGACGPEAQFATLHQDASAQVNGEVEGNLFTANKAKQIAQCVLRAGVDEPIVYSAAHHCLRYISATDAAVPAPTGQPAHANMTEVVQDMVQKLEEEAYNSKKLGVQLSMRNTQEILTITALELHRLTEEIISQLPSPIARDHTSIKCWRESFIGSVLYVLMRNVKDKPLLRWLDKSYEHICNQSTKTIQIHHGNEAVEGDQWFQEQMKLVHPLSHQIRKGVNSRGEESCFNAMRSLVSEHRAALPEVPASQRTPLPTLLEKIPPTVRAFIREGEDGNILCVSRHTATAPFLKQLNVCEAKATSKKEWNLPAIFAVPIEGSGVHVQKNGTANVNTPPYVSESHGYQAQARYIARESPVLLDQLERRLFLTCPQILMAKNLPSPLCFVERADGRYFIVTHEDNVAAVAQATNGEPLESEAGKTLAKELHLADPGQQTWGAVEVAGENGVCGNSDCTGIGGVVPNGHTRTTGTTPPRGGSRTRDTAPKPRLESALGLLAGKKMSVTIVTEGRQADRQDLTKEQLAEIFALAEKQHVFLDVHDLGIQILIGNKSDQATCIYEGIDDLNEYTGRNPQKKLDERDSVPVKWNSDLQFLHALDKALCTSHMYASNETFDSPAALITTFGNEIREVLGAMVAESNVASIQALTVKKVHAIHSGKTTSCSGHTFLKRMAEKLGIENDVEYQRNREAFEAIIAALSAVEDETT